MGGRVPFPVDVFWLLVEDDMLAKPFVLSPSKTGVGSNLLYTKSRRKEMPIEYENGGKRKPTSIS
jgi:hypothetical protein